MKPIKLIQDFFFDFFFGRRSIDPYRAEFAIISMEFNFETAGKIRDLSQKWRLSKREKRQLWIALTNWTKKGYLSNEDYSQLFEIFGREAAKALGFFSDDRDTPRSEESLTPDKIEKFLEYLAQS